MNSIRRSLGVIAANSSAFGLRQPHLERTRLCELADSELDSRYVRQRGDLQAALAALVKPKVIRGKVGALGLARGSAGARSLRASPAVGPRAALKRCRSARSWSVLAGWARRGRREQRRGLPSQAVHMFRVSVQTGAGYACGLAPAGRAVGRQGRCLARRWVSPAAASPAARRAQVLTGPALADLVSEMVGALNARDIPTAGSILEHFNRDLVYKARAPDPAGHGRRGSSAGLRAVPCSALARLHYVWWRPCRARHAVRSCKGLSWQRETPAAPPVPDTHARGRAASRTGEPPRGRHGRAAAAGRRRRPPTLTLSPGPAAQVREEYTAALERSVLPLEEAALEAAHAAALAAALAGFAARRFGGGGGGAMRALQDALVAGCERELAARRTANTLRSGQARAALHASTQWARARR